MRKNNVIKYLSRYKKSQSQEPKTLPINDTVSLNVYNKPRNTLSDTISMTPNKVCNHYSILKHSSRSKQYKQETPIEKKSTQQLPKKSPIKQQPIIKPVTTQKEKIELPPKNDNVTIISKVEHIDTTQPLHKNKSLITDDSIEIKNDIKSHIITSDNLISHNMNEVRSPTLIDNNLKIDTINAIKLRNPTNKDNFTIYNNNFVNCVNDTTGYTLKPSGLQFKSQNNNTIYNIDKIKISLIDNNSHTISATIIDPISVNSKEINAINCTITNSINATTINLNNGKISDTPINPNDIVNKKYVDALINNKQVIDLSEIQQNNIANKNHIQTLNTYFDKINTETLTNTNLINETNSKIAEINNKLTTLEQKVNEAPKVNINSDVIKNYSGHGSIEEQLKDSELILKKLTTESLIIPNSASGEIKFNIPIDCFKVRTNYIDCINKLGGYDTMNIHLINDNEFYIYDDKHILKINPYSGLIQCENGFTIKKYGDTTDKSTIITPNNITTDKIIIPNSNKSDKQTKITLETINNNGSPRLKITMFGSKESSVLYLHPDGQIKSTV